VTAKSNDFKSLFGNEKHSKPQINTGMHFVFSNFHKHRRSLALSSAIAGSPAILGPL